MKNLILIELGIIRKIDQFNSRVNVLSEEG